MSRNMSTNSYIIHYVYIIYFIYYKIHILYESYHKYTLAEYKKAILAKMAISFKKT